MQDDIKAWWLTMKEAKLVNHLTNKLKYPPPIVSAIMGRVKVMREERRKQNIRASVSYQLWAQLLEPARREVATVRVIKSQLKKSDTVDPIRWDTLCRYETMISVLIERLKKVQRLGTFTPLRFVEHLKKEGKQVPPNNGEHWTDWIKYSERQDMLRMFNSLTPPAHGRLLVPFKRRISKQQYLTQKAALIERLNTELSNAEQEYDLITDPVQRNKLDDLIQSMHRANYLLDKHTPRTPLPPTWQGLKET